MFTTLGSTVAAAFASCIYSPGRVRNLLRDLPVTRNLLLISAYLSLRLTYFSELRRCVPQDGQIRTVGCPTFDARFFARLSWESTTSTSQAFVVALVPPSRKLDPRILKEELPSIAQTSILSEAPRRVCFVRGFSAKLSSLIFKTEPSPNSGPSSAIDRGNLTRHPALAQLKMKRRHWWPPRSQSFFCNHCLWINCQRLFSYSQVNPFKPAQPFTHWQS